MTKPKKIIISVVAIVFVLVLLAYLFLGFALKKPGINGFEVTNAMIYLVVSGKEYVKVKENKYIYKTDSFINMIENEYDSYRCLLPDFNENHELPEYEIFKHTLVSKDGKELKGVGVQVFNENYHSVDFRTYEQD
ncbi:MAG: hypothetical protein IJ408_04850 [Clostridia bacterium]|nr:hypothetical protein [Clostridia bacterium]